MNAGHPIVSGHTDSVAGQREATRRTGTGISNSLLRVR